jgi:deoxyribodipyrimidine photolyase-related protein
VAELRTLVVVLGDQLDLDAAAFDGFDAAQDAVWMAEVAAGSNACVVQQAAHGDVSGRHAPLCASAARGRPGLALHAAGQPGADHGSLAAQLGADIERLQPTRLVMTAPGDWRVLQAIKAVAQASGLPLEIREDRHFYCSVREFAAHARGRKSLRMEYFYREMRKRHGVLMRPGGQPEGGQWNFDADNREAFGATGPAPCHPARCSNPMP